MSVDAAATPLSPGPHLSTRGSARRAMFLSQDGVVLATTLAALEEIGIIEASLSSRLSLAELFPSLTTPGFGALRVALHNLVAAGWLAAPATLDSGTTYLDWTAAGMIAMARRVRYLELGRFLSGFDGTADDYWVHPWSQTRALEFSSLVDGRTPGAELDGLLDAHLDGCLVVPAMLWLHETGRLGASGAALPDEEPGPAVGRLFAALGWIDTSGGEWTESGREAARFALNFGGVATYLPTLAKLTQLFRGELTIFHEPGAEEPEWHVHRSLNVRISAAAHRRYFVDSDPLFVEIFDREPLADQPRFVADVGCGEGSWLVHLSRLIATKTRRGTALDEHPLTMIGVDPDPGALELARRNLKTEGARALLIDGDVTDPDRLAADLARHGVDMAEGLHIRSFVDHERTFRGGEDGAAPGYASGVYMDRAGAPLAGEAVERDLVSHLRRWAAKVPKHGMVVLEAHCTAPQITARNLGTMHGLGFDAHQAYSKQYPVGHAAFLEACHQAGLGAVGRAELRYPRARPFVSIGLHRLLADGDGSPLPGLDPTEPRADTWRPPEGMDLEDGTALHEILFCEGDIRHLAGWCAVPTGFVVAGTLAAIEQRLAASSAGETIRVLDYGAGSGTATIELLKACRERALDRRLEERQVELELHLVDLPSSWYAKGFEQLGGCSWTRFHSLRAEDGGFKPLTDVVAGRRFDAAMVSMVFHLIPPRALGRTMDGLAAVLEPGAPLHWSAPDLGPPGEGAVLLHDPNRALRELWLARESAGIDGSTRRRGQERADRRIRPRPLASDVTGALAAAFDGGIETNAFEMLDADIVRGLLVPSNQAEFLPEIPDRDEREAVIRELMLGEVLPTMREGAAGTSHGLNLHWTLGACSRRA